MFHNIVSVTFRRFKKKIHISVIEVQLKSMKGKLFQISLLIHHNFVLGNILQDRKQISYGGL